ncbi:arylsulfatase [Mesorhizobium sp. L-8-10]|uniref:arylsulfatase n=1 Tax=Mesorhizobium sp. L-8-10 TaxID=2744523 RepID=UPI001926D753|nr:arylsulfatase [Mesorhizobium sp. L-8-10]BCH30095.1 arylsulfatase [Mesorhizobium sp. L-8-10]
MTESRPAGRIGRTHLESAPWYEARPKPAPDSPNVIFVVLDDVGYADLGCFGSEIRTPNMDRLAGRGLRYSNFHTTTLCSPTRACLLTGRNHHAVGMRYLANVDMGWPSGRGAISHRAATIAEMLRESGYSTFAVGKWHVAPTDEASAAGPFGQWPLGRGFERFYGFMNGSTDQYYPELIEDNHPVEAPAGPEDGYHLSKDLIDKTIAMLSNHVSLVPEKPFFLNLAFGAGHFPHQVPREFMDRYDGVYEAGWDEVRASRLERQKRMGLVPEATELPPSNPGVEPWSALSPEQRAVAVRLQQAYAGFLEHTDFHFGRLVDFLERVGKLDNTMIVLLSDNGASIDCGPDGTTNVLRWFNQIPDTVERNLAEIDLIGGPRSFTNYPWGWAQASNTPLRLYKSYTHGGGVRDPLIVSWPRRIADHGAIRHQFHHVTDITPTVLEICGVDAPMTFRGVPQMPIHGTSLAYTFADPKAETRKEVQYFEMYGHRSIWHKGWKAVTNHQPATSFDLDDWELYHLDEDFAETRNLAKSHPEKLRELVERWWAEAGKYDVLPLDDRREILFKPAPKPDSIRAKKRFVYHPPISAVPAEAAPLTQDVSHRIEIEAELGDGDAGALVAFGSSAGGYALFVKGGRLVYAYNRCGEIMRLVSDRAIGTGRMSLGFEFRKTGILRGTGRLTVAGRAAGERAFDATLQRISLSPMLIGRSGMPPVVDDYADQFCFSGRIERVTFEIGDDRDLPPPSPEID